MMLFLSRSDPLVPEFPFYMVDMREVVDSPAESSKCVSTQIEQESEAPARNRNQTVRFLKLDPQVLLGPMTVRSTTKLQ
jgi:hypothetical protein